MQFRTIEGRILKRELAPVFVGADGHTGGDTVVVAEGDDFEVLGAHTLECLGLVADPVQRKLVRTIGLALAGPRFIERRSRVVEAIDAALKSGRLTEPFSNREFAVACPGFGRGTYNAFLWKHRRNNPDGKTEDFVQLGRNQFCRKRN